MIKKIILFLVTVLLLFLISCQKEERIVNVYTHRHYEADQMLYDEFTEKTGITVNVVKADADQLIERLKNEGENSPADILITVDAGRLVRAKQAGLLQSIESEILNSNIPEHLRDVDGQWFGLTKRARIIVYNPDITDISGLKTYEDLTLPEWKNEILIRSSSNIYNQSLLASLIHYAGYENALNWATGIVDNFARTPKGNDRDQMKALISGAGSIAIVNTYYLGLLIGSDDPEEQKVGNSLKILFPNQEDRGTHINISGAGVTSSSKNRENAIEFIEYLSSIKAQEIFAEVNYEYPVNPSAKWSPLLEEWGEFIEDTIPMQILGTNNSTSVEIFDIAEWR